MKTPSLQDSLSPFVDMAKADLEALRSPGVLPPSGSVVSFLEGLVAWGSWREDQKLEQMGRDLQRLRDYYLLLREVHHGENHEALVLETFQELDAMEVSYNQLLVGKWLNDGDASLVDEGEGRPVLLLS